nr:S41 family peptidase [Neokomagataea anthophila]
MPRTYAFLICSALISSTFSVSHAATNDPNATGPHAAGSYFREPYLNGTTLLFSAEQSVWSVSAHGGTAQRLTSLPQPGHAVAPHPVSSPDGKWVAFLGNFDGPTEIYIMPSAGGTPKRITFENSARLKLIGWDKNAGILYSAPSPTGPYYNSIVAALDPETGRKTVYPLANINDAALSADGRWIYAVRFGLATTGDHMRSYRGGALSQLWRFDLRNGKEAERIGTRSANLVHPMPWRDRLIVLSDADNRFNLWSLATDGSDAQPLTHFTDDSVLEASISGDHVIFRKGPDLFDLDLTNNTTQLVPISVISDDAPRQAYWLSDPAKFLTSNAIAPKGNAAILTMRGHVVIAGVSPRRIVTIPTPDSIRLRLARATPDGKSILAFNDVSGESALWRFAADGSGAGEAIGKPSPTQPVLLVISPDGKYAAHTDMRGLLWLTDLTHKTESCVDDAVKDGTTSFDSVTWSADSKAIAFVRTRGSSLRRQIALFDLQSKKTTWVTDNRYESYTPVFSPDGHWLWFLSDRTFSLSNGSPWGDRNLGPAFPHRTGIYALALQNDVRFPFLAPTELDVEPTTPSKKQSDSKGEKAKAIPAISWSGLPSRLYQAPVSASDYRGLAASNDFLFTLDATGDDSAALKSIHIDNKEHKTETYAPDVDDFDLSADGKTLLTFTERKNGPPSLLLLPAGAKKPDDMTGVNINLAPVHFHISPMQEWHDEFIDAWRLHRDHYFDRHLQGVDWNGVRAHFEPLLNRLGDRSDLDDLLGQMVAEIGAMHSQIHPAQNDDAPASRFIAGLGAATERQENGFRIIHIYEADKDLPDQQSPLAMPGVDAQNNDVITAINGQSTKDAPDISPLLEDQAGKQVLLTLHRGDKEHKTVVVPVSWRAEKEMRARDWEVNRAEVVDRVSHGRIGYLHLQAMVGSDMEAFAREFYANIDKDGLIIDVRGNNGGNIDSWVLTQLMRRAWMFWSRYDNAPAIDMQQAFQGHLIVLSDEMTYSDGETFSQGIKSLHIASLLGERTAGAGVWLSDADHLVDNGMARTAENPYYDMNGHWLVENKGVSPDIEVENMPVATFHGQDQQLDAAISYLLKDMNEHPRSILKADPFPSDKTIMH